MSTGRNITQTGFGKAPTRRKYLGDPEDPHFVPSSPIISRPSLTYDEEEELTRSCTLVLSGVPHSDENEEDPLMKYITNQIIVKPVKSSQHKEKPVLSNWSVGQDSEFSSKLQRGQNINEDTATPSENSKRTTIDRTSTSTPLTILSDTLHRPLSTRQDCALASESKPSKPQAVYTILARSEPTTAHKDISVRIKSMTSLPTSQKITESQPDRVVSNKTHNVNISHVEFNKSLPSLPHVDSTTSVEQQDGGLLRILKTMKKKKKAATKLDHNVPLSSQSQRTETFPITPTNKKSKFSFILLFDRRRRT